MRPGEIYLAKFPFGDAPGMKIRPVLLLTDPVGIVPEILVAYISSFIINARTKIPHTKNRRVPTPGTLCYPLGHADTQSRGTRPSAANPSKRHRPCVPVLRSAMV